MKTEALNLVIFVYCTWCGIVTKHKIVFGNRRETHICTICGEQRGYST